MSGEMMTFPKTWEEYEKYWGFNDSEEVYTNNARLIPSYRVKQWLDHIKEAEPNDYDKIARDIATIIENEMDMRVILRNSDPDIVRVVRCKDCDRSQVDFDDHGEVTFRCRLYDPFIVYVKSDGLGFCSNAKRRD